MPQHTNIQVFEESIDLTFPSAHVKMLVVQPYLQFHQPLQEPYKLLNECGSRMLSGIDNVFALSNTFQPNVILFPEFSLPGVEAVERVQTALLSTVTRPLVVIAGVHGLTRDEYARLCSLTGVPVRVDPANSSDVVGKSEWVNTSVTFVKNNHGQLTLWLQPKLSPSWPESNTPHQSMFRGTAVRIFRARFDNDVPCHFFSLLCYDWIGRESGSPVPDAMLTQFNSICRQANSPQSVQWAFVLQHNQKPNDHTFLGAAKAFLTLATEYPFVQRQHAAVVMACTAASLVPARTGPHGFSSLIFNPVAPFDVGSCMPTFSTKPKRLRATDALGTCKDVLFREMGECIHLLEVRIPLFVVPDSTDRTAPLERAEVFPLNPPVDDPRIPGAAVPATVKWANDELDTIPDLVAPYFGGSELEGLVRTAQRDLVSSYRHLPSQRLALKIHSATAARATDPRRNHDPAVDADEWDTQERCGLRHVIQTLTLIGGVAVIDPAASKLHARHTPNGVEIAAICGSTHSTCMRAFHTLAQSTHSPILLVSRDDNNATFLPKELESFADPRPDAGFRLTDSNTLLTMARSSTEGQYRVFITELLDVRDKRII